VIAVEVDPRLARLLRRRFQSDGRVTVVEADGLSVALPPSPFRVVANLPFAITTPMLRRLLDDPGLALLAADLVVQRGFAVKRCSPRPCTLLSAGWLPWWQLTVERVLPPGCFQPPPSVESAILSARRRPRPLVGAAAAGDYRLLLRRGFRRDNRPVRLALGLERGRWASFSRPRGLPDDARPTQLDVWDWAALHSYLRSSGAARGRVARA
jgi:23S rRNA (adenine-N6)-dimethyltransferase